RLSDSGRVDGLAESVRDAASSRCLGAAGTVRPGTLHARALEEPAPLRLLSLRRWTTQLHRQLVGDGHGAARGRDGGLALRSHPRPRLPRGHEAWPYPAAEPRSPDDAARIRIAGVSRLARWPDWPLGRGPNGPTPSNASRSTLGAPTRSSPVSWTATHEAASRGSQRPADGGRWARTHVTSRAPT